MAERLRVDIDAVREAAKDIHDLREQIAATSGHLHDVKVIIGDETLSDTLDAFANGWRIHREQLVADLDAFSGWVQNAADAYSATDQGLAQGVTPEHKGTTAGRVVPSPQRVGGPR